MSNRRNPDGRRPSHGGRAPARTSDRSLPDRDPNPEELRQSNPRREPEAPRTLPTSGGASRNVPTTRQEREIRSPTNGDSRASRNIPTDRQEREVHPLTDRDLGASRNIPTNRQEQDNRRPTDRDPGVITTSASSRGGHQRTNPIERNRSAAVAGHQQFEDDFNEDGGEGHSGTAIFPRANPMTGDDHPGSHYAAIPRSSHVRYPRHELEQTPTSAPSRESTTPKKKSEAPPAGHWEQSSRPGPVANASPNISTILLQRFQQLPLSDFSALKRFIDSHQQFLKLNPQILYDEAVQAIINNDHVAARRCIQGFVALSNLSGRSVSEVQRILNGLINGGDTTNAFHQKVTAMYEKAKNDAKNRPKPRSSTVGHGHFPRKDQDRDPTPPPITTSRSNTRSDNDTLRPMTEGMTALKISKPAIQAYQQVEGHSISGYNYSNMIQARSGEEHSGAYSYTNPGSNATSASQVSHTRRYSVTSPNEMYSKQSPALPTPLASASFNGTDGVQPRDSYSGIQSIPPGSNAQYSDLNPAIAPRLSIQGELINNDRAGEAPLHAKLDECYKVRNSTFFCRGRVFALLWHENASRPAESYLSKVTKVWIGAMGEEVYSTIRRMIVVRQGHGFSLCVQINTYSGRGLLKFRKNKTEVQSHAIAYMTGTKPKLLENEPSPVKNSIAIKKSSPEQKLNIASRINFARIHTVEHTTKVMDVGLVTDESLSWLLRYYREEQGLT